MKLIGYLSNGYPSFDKSFDLAKQYYEAGIDNLQIDIPADDPYLESKYIAERMYKSLEACRDYEAYMNNIAKIHSAMPGLNIILLVYEYTLQAIGMERFIQFCREQNLYSMTCIGGTLPEIKKKLMNSGIYVSSYIQFQLEMNEIRNAEQTNGFIYLQFKPQKDIALMKRKTIGECIEYLRSRFASNREIYTGVGLRTSRDIIEARRAGSDGAFIGSSIMKYENHPAKLIQKIQEFKKASAE